MGTGNRLNVKQVAALTAPGRYADGDGLYLQVSKSGSRSWVFRWRDRQTKKLRELGTQPAKAVSLAAARVAAGAARTVVHAGGDPITDRKAEPIKSVTFGEAADDFIDTRAPSFKDPRHAKQWQITLRNYCARLDKPVAEVDTADVLGVLKPLWQIHPAVAAKLRGQIQQDPVGGTGTGPAVRRKSGAVARPSGTLAAASPEALQRSLQRHGRR